MAATAERPAMLRCRVLQGETSVLTTEKGREPSTVHHAWRNSRGRFAYITIADGNKRAQKYTQHLWRRIYQWSRQNGTLRQNGPAPCFRGEGLFFISCSKLSSGFRLGWFFFQTLSDSRVFIWREDWPCQDYDRIRFFLHPHFSLILFTIFSLFTFFIFFSQICPRYVYVCVMYVWFFRF